MDGLLLDTEDIYTLIHNIILEKYQRPKLPWTLKAQLQGRPGPDATKLFSEWAKLPISDDEYKSEVLALHREHFPHTQPLPGVAKLLGDLARTRYWELKKSEAAKQNADLEASPSGKGKAAAEATVEPTLPHRVHIALATSAHHSNFLLKTTHLSELFSVFESHRRVLGDDKRIPPGRGKPLPDIYLLALRTINESLPAGEKPITPEECLVFEDSVPGVEAGRRAGMRVVWCPHPMLKNVYTGREGDVLAGRTGAAGDVDLHQLGEVDDGWAQYYPTLIDFPYERYNISIPSPEVNSEPCMRESVKLDKDEEIQIVRTAVPVA